MGKDTFTLAGREWPKCSWWKMKGMRSTYVLLWAAMITSATNGETPCWRYWIGCPADSMFQDMTAPS